MINLPNAENITQENMLEVLKRVVTRLKEVNDSSVVRDVELRKEMQGFRKDVNKRFESLEGTMNKRIESLEGTMNKRFESLEGKVDTHMTEQTYLLRQLVENTKKD